MAPTYDMTLLALAKRSAEPTTTRTSPSTRESLTTEGGILEAWAQGYNVGSLVILILIVFCNYRSGIRLHKLILLELVLAVWHGTFIFARDPVYGWYLSVTATLLFISYFLHNLVSWLKIRPFLPRWGSRFFIISLLCVQPFWVAEAWSNFAYFNSLGSNANVRTRPFEALLRDPWWIFTTWTLVSSIKKTYGFKLWALVRINKRFGVMLLCMALSIVFLLTDVAISAAKLSTNSGINPYWRFALVFKCASDTIFLDDFKSILDSIVARKFSSTGDGIHRNSIGPSSNSHSGGHKRSRSLNRGEDFIECISLENPVQRPVHTSMPFSQSSPPKSKYLNIFSKGRRASMLRINVQNDTADRTQARTPSHESWGSDSAQLARPAHAVYINERGQANESDASLFNGRMV
ncbi:hypothetical protein BDU57DRAFT_97534 [Ampelomyces quisqualis]|uniref:Uncharacterized protein n=1 Tax=Ampelomyces quisqualis TaxID=50730 RepID=A0A6A5Q5P0_AMPQU|nr:hypothetical protein BDU57DRAFT_97534 [Ampelomyces quisqualis]